MPKPFRSFHFPYRIVRTDAGDVPYPLLPVYLFSNGKFIRREFIVDTGADVTTLPYFMASELGISLRSLPQSQSQGIGKTLTRTWETKILLKIGDLIFKARCSFVASNRIPPLLGKLDLFDRFNLYFDNDRARLELSTRHPPRRQRQ